MRTWPEADSEVLLLSLLIANPEREDLGGSGLSDRRIQKLASIQPSSRQLATQLSLASSGGESLSLLDRAPAETVAMVECLFPALAPVLQPLRRLRNLKLDFEVESLGLPPGPHLGRALRETRHALALGKIAQGGSFTFARSLGLQYLEESPPAMRPDDSNRVS